jgi:ketosteroid isomerase-like protein
VSWENVELVRRAFAAWEHGDFLPDELWAEDLEWHPSPDDPDTSPTRPRAAVYSVLREWLDHLGRYEAEFEFIDTEDDVIVCMRALLVGAKTPIVAYFTCKLANGKISRVHAYSHRNDALKAVGLQD